ncbi:MAG TPA: hypothetical protein VMW01_16870 [Williamwhitmania sp.]|nr:hypothetical protein [Williamwhitmania sp.]
MQDVFTTAVVFFGIYYILRMFTNFLLKRKIIKSGHFDKADILNEITVQPQENENRYPTLKWGLVALMAGIGLLVDDQFFNTSGDYSGYAQHGMAPFGIELMFIAAGFLIYFFIANAKKK